MEWIPIYKKQPQKYQRVLVVCYNIQNPNDTAHVSICEYWGRHPNNRYEHSWSGKKHVTHWMPLPEIPDSLKVIY